MKIETDARGAKSAKGARVATFVLLSIIVLVMIGLFVFVDKRTSAKNVAEQTQTTLPGLTSARTAVPQDIKDLQNPQDPEKTHVLSFSPF
jgi:hypothetical protein